MSQTKEVPLWVVLQITLDRMVHCGSESLDCITDLVGFMVGSDFVLGFSEAMKACRTALLSQHQWLCSKEMKKAICDFDHGLREAQKKKKEIEFVSAWLQKQAAEHGETVEVTSICRVA